MRSTPRSRLWPPARRTVRYARIAAVVWWLVLTPLFLIQEWPFEVRVLVVALFAFFLFAYTMILGRMARRREVLGP